MALPPQKPSQKVAPPVGAELSARAEAERQKIAHATDELADQCQALEEELEELKAKYEMYFLGVERLEPTRWRNEVKKNVSRLKGASTRNTGLRFRIQSLHARFLSYERLWLRAARQKEEGTYRRDVFKARRRQAPPPAKVAPAPGQPEEAAPPQPLAPPPPAAASPVAPPPVRAGPPSIAGLNPAQMRALYDAYISAKKRCNEDVSRLSYESVTRSVEKQIPEILSRYQAKSVEFKVVIKGGKAILKAVPKT